MMPAVFPTDIVEAAALLLIDAMDSVLTACP